MFFEQKSGEKQRVILTSLTIICVSACTNRTPELWSMSFLLLISSTDCRTFVQADIGPDCELIHKIANETCEQNDAYKCTSRSFKQLFTLYQTHLQLQETVYFPP